MLVPPTTHENGNTMNATPAAQATIDAPKATEAPKVEVTKPTSTTSTPVTKKAAPAKKATPAKAPAKKASVAKKASAPAKKTAAPVKKASDGKKVIASTDANHQKWQTLKRELTAVMADLLYDSRRVNPDHSKSQDEATAKVTAALKVLSEFKDSIRLK